jgi:16S rRNA (guanine527-N7)-methyltransferase
MDFKTALVSKGQEAGFCFAASQIEQFETYSKMLLETNKVMNLTAITEPEEVAVKHMIDSLLVYETKGFSGKTLVDVGTGAGFPGLPLKIYDNTLKVTLIDSLAKRLNFLNKVIEALELKDITCAHLRAEDAGKEPGLREKFDIAVARAVAPLPVLAEYCLPLVKVGGCFYAMKGNKYEKEIEDGKRALGILGGRIKEIKEVKLPGLEDKRTIIIVEKHKKTPAGYPRKAGIVAKKPL